MQPGKVPSLGRVTDAVLDEVREWQRDRGISVHRAAETLVGATGISTFCARRATQGSSSLGNRTPDATAL